MYTKNIYKNKRQSGLGALQKEWSILRHERNQPEAVHTQDEHHKSLLRTRRRLKTASTQRHSAS